MGEQESARTGGQEHEAAAGDQRCVGAGSAVGSVVAGTPVADAEGDADVAVGVGPVVTLSVSSGESEAVGTVG